jgi:hypothetical protein
MYSFIVLFIYVVLSVFIVIMEHAYEEITDERSLKKLISDSSFDNDHERTHGHQMHSESEDITPGMWQARIDS